jgi:ribosomal protein S18 acetylase RimI-like enzyme
MSVREAKSDDLEAVARIHKARFSHPNYLLGQYSIGLIREFYAAFLARAVFLVHVREGEVDGFILAGMPDVVRACKRSFIRNNLPRCVAETAFRPRVWLHSVRTLRGLFRHRRNPAGANPDKSMRFLSFGIADGNRRGGAAITLLASLEARIRDVCPGYQAVVRRSNTQLLQFYERVGFQQVADNGNVVTLRKSFAGPA